MTGRQMMKEMSRANRLGLRMGRTTSKVRRELRHKKKVILSGAPSCVRDVYYNGLTGHPAFYRGR
jgi:hypothetical protein